MTPFDHTSPTTPRRSPYSVFLLLGVILVMVIACAVSLSASPRLQSLLVGSTPTHSPTVPLATLPPLDLGRSELSDLAMVSSDDGWIVGKNSGYALILRYQGGHWLPQSATIASSWLQAVAFADTQHGWAVGSHASNPSDGSHSTEALVLHYQQGHWSRVLPSITIIGTLTKIRLVAPDEWWALNNRGESSSPALVHYRQGVWSVLPMPADLDDVHGLAVAGPDDVWLGTIGGVAHVQSGIIGRSLQDISGNLLAVDLSGKQDIWAVGLTFCGAASPTSTTCDQRVAIYHYDGAAWTPSATQARGMLYAVAAIGANDVWAVGYGADKAGRGSLILHYHTGEWHQYSTDFAIGLNALSMTSSTEGWAVGYAEVANGAGIAPGLLHFRDGIWTQVTLG